MSSGTGGITTSVTSYMGPPAPTPGTGGSMSTAVRDFVPAQFVNAMAYADAAYQNARTYLESLRSEIGIIDVDTSYDYVEEDLNIGANVVKPDTPDTSMNTVAVPEAASINDVTIDEISPVPGWDIATLVLSFPDIPDMIVPSDVGAPSDIVSPELPEVPAYEIPSVPFLVAATVPDSPSLTMPEFTATVPIDDLVAPTGSINFTETVYSSTLLSNLQTSLNNTVVNGGTGLGASVEEALWIREQERAERALRESKERIEEEWSASGFSLPDGVLASALLDEETKYLESRLTTSRDISIEQAKLADANTKFAKEQALLLESKFIDYSSSRAQRELEAQKAVIDASVSIFNAQVQKYNARIEGYKAQAVVFDSLIRAELGKVEIFKAQVDAARAVSEINRDQVALYTSRIQAITALMGVYTAQMEGAKIQTEIEKLKLDSYRAKIDYFTALVALNNAQYNAYDSAIKGESAKAQVYNSQVEAYKSRVEALKVESDMALGKAKIQSELEKTKIEIYATNIEAYKSQIEAEKARIEAIVDAYKGEIEAYRVDGEVAKTVLDSQVEVFKGRITQALNVSNLHMKQAEIELAEYSKNADVSIEISKALAQISAQVAASTLAGLNANAGMSASDSVSYSDSRSFSAGISVSDSYSDSDQRVNSISQSWSHTISDNTSRQDGTAYSDITEHKPDVTRIESTNINIQPGITEHRQINENYNWEGQHGRIPLAYEHYNYNYYETTSE